MGVTTSISVPIEVNKVRQPYKVGQPYATLRIEIPVIGGNYIVRSYNIKREWLKSYHIWESP